MPRTASLFVLVTGAALTAQSVQPPLGAPVIAFPGSTSMDAMGDFNGDGIADFVGWYYGNSFFNSANLRVYLGDGAGGFHQAAMGLGGTQHPTDPWTLEVGRIDGDGVDDFVATFNANVAFAHGTAGGDPIPSFGWTEASPVIASVLADFDGDGFGDLALATAAGEIRLYHGGAGFSLVSTLPGGRELRSAELTGDGLPDLYWDSGDTIEIVTVVGNTLVAGASYHHGVQVAEDQMHVDGDIDGDGDDDLVVFAGAGTYVVVRQTAPGVFAVEPRALGGPATGLADIDGDGDLDGTCCGGGGPTSVSNDGVSTFHFSLNDGTGRFARAWLVEGTGGKRFAGAADVDGDGDLDMVAGRSILFNDGTFATEPEPAVPSTGETNLLPIDLDRDGDVDLVYPPSQILLRNDGNAGLTSVPIAFPTAPAGTSFRGPGFWGDFDGDGATDVVVGHVQGSTMLGMRLLRNVGDGRLVDVGQCSANGVNFNDSATPIRFGDFSIAADLDGDGDVDIAVGHEIGLVTIQVWRNTGFNTFARAAVFFAGIPIHVGDLDGDGIVDIVSSYNSGAIQVHWGLGDGTFPTSTPVNATVDYTDDRLAVGDFDGDGRLDLANADKNQRAVLVWRQNANRTFTMTALPIAVPYTSSAVAYRADALDLDGDGNADLVASPVENNGGARSCVLLGDGLGGFAAPLFQHAGPRAIADLDGDGDLDFAGTRVVRGSRWHVPADGLRLQYGSGGIGMGNHAPILGATGPFRVGEQNTIRLTGAVGVTPVLIGVGTTPVDLPGQPAPDLSLYVGQLVGSVFLFTGGAPGIGGVGAAELSFVVPPSARGQQLFWQALVLDTTRASQLGYSNGLRTRWGN